MIKIPFNKPYLTGKEIHYIYDAVFKGHLSGNGIFTRKCHSFFENRYKFGKCLLTTSCTDALEMAALLVDIKPGDEVIIPSYTFVSTANAFVRNGAKIIFADSRADYPGIDEDAIEQLITDRTKAIVPVHYGGVACDMSKIMKIAKKYNLFVIEDAAHAINSYYIDPKEGKKALGSLGDLSTFSFHETKNVISGEGGMLIVNEEALKRRSEIIWEKGTNRADFFRGKVDKYEWVDLGSSFMPSELIAAFLWAQLENMEELQHMRNKRWNYYHENLIDWASSKDIQVPYIPEYSTNNGHIYYLIFKNQNQRDLYINKLKQVGIQSIFHYQSLHNSKYYKDKHNGRKLENAERYSNCLLRLPLFYELTQEKQKFIVDSIKRI